MAKLIIGIGIFLFLAIYDYLDLNVKYIVYAGMFAVAFAIAAWFDSVAGLMKEDDEL